MTLSYQQAVERLYSYMYRGLAPEALHQPDEGRPRRAAALLAAFGDPQLHCKTIHVTGTKGKGSVCVMVAGILQAAGYRVGLLTSPHLQDIRERIQVNRTMITEQAFADLVNDCLPVFETMTTTRFPECLNTLAFRYFEQQAVDFAVIEVGVGGRLDATNVLKPEVAVFTSISMDHTHLLGDTLAAIAAQKADIVKPGCAVVSAPQAPEAQAVIRARAATLGCPLAVAGADIPFVAHPPEHGQQRVRIGPLVKAQVGPETYTIGLLGEHQGINAAVAVGVIDALVGRGFRITPEAIREGLAGVWWPGRFEVVRSQPLLILDGAHNGESAQRLVQTVRALYPNRAAQLVFGAKAHKDVAAILVELVPLASHITLTRAADQIAQNPEALVPYLVKAGYGGTYSIEPQLNAALEAAIQRVGSDGLVLLTGSLYLVGDARTILGLRPNQAS